MIPFITSRWAPDSHESAWAALGNGALECGVHVSCFLQKLRPFDAGTSVSSARSFDPRYFMACAACRFMFAQANTSCVHRHALHAEGSSGALPQTPPKELSSSGLFHLLPRFWRSAAFLHQMQKSSATTARRFRRLALSPVRNATQDSSRDHRGAESGQPQCGSNWPSALPTHFPGVVLVCLWNWRMKW